VNCKLSWPSPEPLGRRHAAQKRAFLTRWGDAPAADRQYRTKITPGSLSPEHRLQHTPKVAGQERKKHIRKIDWLTLRCANTEVSCQSGISRCSSLGHSKPKLPALLASAACKCLLSRCLLRRVANADSPEQVLPPQGPSSSKGPFSGPSGAKGPVCGEAASTAWCSLGVQ
jgi:hypothetical protein